ncbi:MAG: [protein-PII] uridylyltransferase [Alphaproteobacteria bacterium]|nr:[protein-PII] uridylyltransferase [Alphaproteobacteria bacterium]
MSVPVLKTNPSRRRRTFVLTRAETIVTDTLATLESEGAPANSNRARTILLDRARAALGSARAQAEADLLATGKGTRCARDLCAAEDEIVKAALRFALAHVLPPPPGRRRGGLTIAAVGGYGRGTLAPGSDIDLLFILPSRQTEWAEKVAEFVLYLLWDLGQKVGHAVRSITDCLKMARTDMTVRTATLEARFLAGDQKLFDVLQARFEKSIVAHTGPEFIAAKMAERDARHARIGDTRYVVEPDIKDGKGGLRDLNTLFWIAKYFYRVKTGAELVKKNVFSQTEFRLFQRAEDFLWAVRCHMHFSEKSTGERLTFEVQRDLADRLGFSDRHGLMGVERLMKRYFLIAKDVGDLTRIFCVSLEFAHAKDADLIGRIKQRLRGRRKIAGEPDFMVNHGRLSVANDAVFGADPINLIKIFWLAGRLDLRFHPDALKLITRSLKAINATVRTDRRANGYFLEILTSVEFAERILRRMNEAGVLGRFIPEFGKIVALMQFNMYHHYTVDEHLIRAVGIMASIDRGGLRDDLPLTHELLPHLADKRLLYVALFLHDIAKGRREDHSIVGARIARRLCPRFGLSSAETETVAWLIEVHLVMSEVSQTRDIQDPVTTRRFADLVQSPNRLDLLLILTACDIRAVGPGVWNGWKGTLLRALYFATEPLLSGGHSRVSQKERAEEAQQALAAQMPGWPEADRKTYLGRHYTAYWLRAEPELQLDHAAMIQKAEAEGERFAAFGRVKTFEAVTELSFFTLDHPRLLAIIAGACTLANASIIGAQIFSMRDGNALDTFRIRRAFANDDDERQRADRIIASVRALLRGEKYLPKKIGRDSRHNRRIKPFSVAAEVQISNSLSVKFTVIEASGLDRTGLLYELTCALSDLNLTIGSAHIATYGEKAVDVFYVTDLTGMKVVDELRQRRIRHTLMDVLDPPKIAPKTAAPKTAATKTATPKTRAGGTEKRNHVAKRTGAKRPGGTKPSKHGKTTRLPGVHD